MHLLRCIITGIWRTIGLLTAFAQSSLAVQACQLVLACPCWLHAQYLTWLAPAFAKQHHGQYYSQNQQAQ